MTKTESDGAQRDIVFGASASGSGMKLWRNNVGVLIDRDGRPVRFGLANDSKALNEALKSGDLIGWTPRDCPHCGRWRAAVFTSIEAKREGWQWKGTNREVAQAAWAELVLKSGGMACFATCWEDVRRLWSV